MQLRGKLRQDMQIRNHSERTIGQYISLTGKFFEWLGKPPGKATRDDVRDFLLYIINEEGVCKYCAGYTHRVGISNKRIVAVRDGRVHFLARQRAKDGTYLGMREVSLDADRFISRFLLHVLPRGYTRIRHYGLTAPRNIKTQIPLACALIKEAGVLSKPEPDADRDTEPPTDPSVCPKCGGRMLVLRTFDPVRRDPFNTS